MKVKVSSQFKVAGTSDLDKQTDSLFDVLMDLEREESDLSEADVTATLGNRLVGITVVIETVTWEQAEDRAREVITLAIERIGDYVLPPGGDSALAVSGEPVADIQSIELVPA